MFKYTLHKKKQKQKKGKKKQKKVFSKKVNVFVVWIRVRHILQSGKQTLNKLKCECIKGNKCNMFIHVIVYLPILK